MIKNCPPLYYTNCLPQNCYSCAAKTGRGKLLYKPTEDIGEHPYDVKTKASNSKAIQKKAVATEKAVVNQLIRLTAGSGRINHDGDVKLDDLRIEVKDRGVKKSFALTLTEFDKGLRQSIDAFAVSINRPDTGKREVVYMLTEQMFSELISLRRNQDG